MPGVPGREVPVGFGATPRGLGVGLTGAGSSSSSQGVEGVWF